MLIWMQSGREMSIEHSVEQVEFAFRIPLELGVEFAILIYDIVSCLSDVGFPCFLFVNLRDHFRQQLIASYIVSEIMVRQT